MTRFPLQTLKSPVHPHRAFFIPPHIPLRPHLRGRAVVLSSLAASQHPCAKVGCRNLGHNPACLRRGSKAVMHRIANPCRSVRLRPAPPSFKEATVRNGKGTDGYDTANFDHPLHLDRGLVGWPLLSHSLISIPSESAAPTALFCCLRALPTPIQELEHHDFDPTA